MICVRHIFYGLENICPFTVEVVQIHDQIFGSNIHMND